MGSVAAWLQGGNHAGLKRTECRSRRVGNLNRKRSVVLVLRGRGLRICHAWFFMTCTQRHGIAVLRFIA